MVRMSNTRLKPDMHARREARMRKSSYSASKKSASSLVGNCCLHSLAEKGASFALMRETGNLSKTPHTQQIYLKDFPFIRGSDQILFRNFPLIFTLNL